MTLFSKLRELEKKATPGPWRSDSDGDVWTEAEKEYCPGMDQELFRNLGTTRCGPDRGDAALTAEMRNSLPKLFEVLDLYEGTLALILAEESLALDSNNKPDYQSEIDWKRMSVKEALKRAKEIAGG